MCILCTDGCSTPHGVWWEPACPLRMLALGGLSFHPLGHDAQCRIYPSPTLWVRSFRRWELHAAMCTWPMSPTLGIFGVGGSWTPTAGHIGACSESTHQVLPGQLSCYRNSLHWSFSYRAAQWSQLEASSQEQRLPCGIPGWGDYYDVSSMHGCTIPLSGYAGQCCGPTGWLGTGQPWDGQL